MHAVFWILQVMLALKFVSVSYTHGLHPDQTKMQRGVQRLGRVARPLLFLIALCSFLGGVSLILPAAFGTLTWLTPLSAALLSLMMILAIGFHIVCRENPNIVPGLVICALAAILAYGRWVIAPL